MTRATQRYQEMDVQAMSPPDLIVFLYSLLLAQLHRARRALAEGDAETRNQTIMKAQDVVEELQVALDRQAGGKLADDLAALYDFFSRELTAVDLESDHPRLQRVISLVASLHEAWTQAATIAQPDPPALLDG